jgi:aldehyde:ferredoxin oxidoreductase
MPAYDPRAVKGLGVTYATTPMGADHTAGYATTANILKVGGDVDPLKPQGQVELSQGLQVATASIDTAGLCLFVAFAVLDIPDAMAAIVDMLNAKYGWSISADDVNDLGKKVLKIEKDFNTKAGFNKADDRLPDFFKYEKLKPHDVVFDVSDEDLDKTLDF